MIQYPKIVLKPGKEAAVQRFHPWIFSGAIQNIEGDATDGMIVEVCSARKEFLALGFYLGGSIAVKIFLYEQVQINEKYWLSKIKAAFDFRCRLGLTNGSVSNSYRLVFSEGDMLPGLIIDYYNGVAVIQTHTMGMHLLLPVFTDALREVYGKELVAVYNKSGETMGSSRFKVQGSRFQVQGSGFQVKDQDQFLFGNSSSVEIIETGHRFMVDFIRGQKTGFFLDQRGNRMFAQYYARNRKVLNAFCYSGAFSVYALKGSATSVHSVDSSKQAIEWTNENIKLNGLDQAKHTSEVADIKQYLVNTKEKFDLIILDPPAFAKTHLVTNNALHAYIHINAEAMKRLNPGGLLFTFSCSQPVSREMFRSAIQSAAIETKKQIRILHQLSQGPDHPVDICHPEGEYLKGLILMVQ